MKKETLAVVNGVDIICFTNTEEKLMPIKPICDALGVDYDAEIMNIQDHGFGDMLEDFNDGEWESHGTSLLSIEFVLGWVLNVKYKNTLLESEDLCRKYIIECVNAISDYAFGTKEQRAQYEKKLLEVQAMLDEVEDEDNEEY